MKLKSKRLDSQRFNVLKPHVLTGVLDNSDLVNPNRSVFELFNSGDLNHVEKYLSDNQNNLSVDLIPDESFKQPRQYLCKEFPLPPYPPHDPYVPALMVPDSFVPHSFQECVMYLDFADSQSNPNAIRNPPEFGAGVELYRFTIPDIYTRRQLSDAMYYHLTDYKLDNQFTYDFTESLYNDTEDYVHMLQPNRFRWKGKLVDARVTYSWGTHKVHFYFGYYGDFSYIEPFVDYSKYEVLYLEQ